MSNEEKTVKLQIDVKESTRTKLRVEAAKEGRSMGEIADEILAEQLKKREEQSK